MGYQLRQIAKRVFPPTKEERLKKAERKMLAQNARHRFFGIGAGLVKKLSDDNVYAAIEKESRLRASDKLQEQAHAKRMRRAGAR